MKKLRLLYTPNCDRACPGCCNKDWELDKLPVFEIDFNSVRKFGEIIITGGEPMLYPIGVAYICNLIKSFNDDVKIYIYTARTKVWNHYHEQLLKIVDGFTITIHDQKSADEFVETEKFLRKYSNNYKGKSMRLNVFDKCELPYPEGYIVKDSIVWKKDCPLPTDEVFMTL